MSQSTKEYGRYTRRTAAVAAALAGSAAVSGLAAETAPPALPAAVAATSPAAASPQLVTRRHFMNMTRAYKYDKDPHQAVRGYSYALTERVAGYIACNDKRGRPVTAYLRGLASFEGDPSTNQRLAAKRGELAATAINTLIERDGGSTKVQIIEPLVEPYNSKVRGDLTRIAQRQHLGGPMDVVKAYDRATLPLDMSTFTTLHKDLADWRGFGVSTTAPEDQAPNSAPLYADVCANGLNTPMDPPQVQQLYELPLPR